MSHRLTIKGQVTIPKEIREFLGLEEGNSCVEFAVEDDGTVTVRKAEATRPRFERRRCPSQTVPSPFPLPDRRFRSPLPLRHPPPACDGLSSCGRTASPRLTRRAGYGRQGSDTHFSSKIPLWFETSPFRGKRGIDKTAKPMKSFSVPPPFREGRSARPLSVGRGGGSRCPHQRAYG